MILRYTELYFTIYVCCEAMRSAHAINWIHTHVAIRSSTAEERLDSLAVGYINQEDRPLQTRFFEFGTAVDIAEYFKHSDILSSYAIIIVISNCKHE